MKFQHIRSDALEQTLEHLSKQDFSGSWETIVVNNNSTDDTDEVVRSWQVRFPVELKAGAIQNRSSGGRNADARAAKGQYLVFIDNDILTGPDFHRMHVKLLTRES